MKDTRTRQERRGALLAQIRKALDAFYLLQRIDWDYDIQETLAKILELCTSELKSDDLEVERAMIVLKQKDRSLACQAGWYSEKAAAEYSRSVVEEVLATGKPVVCADTRSDERFARGHSVRIKRIERFVCLPIEILGERVGAFFVDSSGSARAVQPEDVTFLSEFVSIISPYIKTALLLTVHADQMREIHPPLFCGMVGRSPRMQQLFDQIRLLAQTDATVLVYGETGTGKELVARAIHQTSKRAQQPFVAVSCAAMPEALLESELFGHVRGAFSGADRDRDGLALAADGGSLFLDEIAEIGPQVQAKLLRFLQDQEFRPVGGDKPVTVDVRVIAATNRDLRAQVEAKRFREDLYYRIDVLPITVPSLRERQEDLPDLIAHFLERANRDNDKQVGDVAPEALAALRRYRWEGNVRQLDHTLQRAVLFARGGQIRLEDLPDEVRGAGPSLAELGFQRTLEDVRRELGEAGEKEYIERALDHIKEQAAGRVELVEKAIVLIPECSASTLRRRIKLLEIDLARFAAKQTGRKR